MEVLFFNKQVECNLVKLTKPIIANNNLAFATA